LALDPSRVFKGLAILQAILDTHRDTLKPNFNDTTTAEYIEIEINSKHFSA